MLRSKGLFNRLLSLLLFTVVILFVGLSISFYVFKDTMSEEKKKTGIIVPEIIGKLETGRLLDENNRNKLFQHIANYSNRTSLFRISVLDKDGIIIASSEPDVIGIPMMSDMVMYVINRNRNSFPRNTYYGNIKVNEKAYPIRKEGKVEGVLLVAEYPDSYVRDSNIQLSKVSVFLLVLLGCLLVSVIALYIKRFFGSLGKLSGAVSNFAQGNYKERITLHPDSEFGLLAESFNQIAENMENRIVETEVLNKNLERTNLEKEKSLAVLSQMAGGLAHEIRNPLGGIRGFTELLKSEMETEDSKLKYVNYILKEVTILESLVQNVLDFARPKRPGFALTTIDSLIESFTPVMEKKINDLKNEDVEINFITEIVPEVNDITGDPIQLRQLLLNLLLNGCDAMDQAGGDLYLTARPLRAEEHEIIRDGDPEKYTAIILRDSGCGIDGETLENLFTPFFTTKAQGTGLGLAICKRIVELHGGFIRVSSTIDVGTEFLIILPRTMEENKN